MIFVKINVIKDWELSTHSNVSGNLFKVFNANNIAGFDYINEQTLVSVENYKTAFVLLGVYGYSYDLNSHSIRTNV